MMRRITPLILACLAGILLALLFRPSPEPVLPDKSIVDTLRVQLAKERINTQAIAKKLGTDTLKMNARLEALKIENSTLKKQQAKLRPQVQAIADTSAILHEFLTVQDLIQDNDSLTIQTQALEIRELRRDMVNVLGYNQASERIHNELMSHQEVVIEILEEDNKKLRRKLLFTKIGGVIVLLGIVALSL